MDPQANIEEQVRLARTFLAVRDGVEFDPKDVARLSELVLALVEWRAGGGSDPDWRRAREQR